MVLCGRESSLLQAFRCHCSERFDRSYATPRAAVLLCQACLPSHSTQLGVLVLFGLRTLQVHAKFGVAARANSLAAAPG